MKQKNGGLKKKRGRNAEKNNRNHPDNTVSGGGAVVQLQLFPAVYHPVNDKFTAAWVAASTDMGVEIMVVAGAVLALAGVAFLLVCCLLAGSREDRDK